MVSRFLTSALKSHTGKKKAIILTGARQVGKTTLLQEFFSEEKKMIWLNADEQSVRERLKNLSIEVLKGVVGNNQVLVIDEVQRVENAGLLLKLLVDNFKDLKIVATGSSSIDISNTIFEPLTGRQFLFHLYPFSLTEIYPDNTPFQIEQKLPFHLIYGCYPDVFNNQADAEIILRNLSGQYLYQDVLVWKDIRKPAFLDSLLRLLAYQVGFQVSYHELGNNLKIKSSTVEAYVDILEKAFVIFRLPAFSKNPRKEISKSNKIFFWDNGIRNAVIDDYRPLSQRDDAGLLWENFAISERMKLHAHLNRHYRSYFWRNYNGSEVDYIEEKHGNVSAYEMKWNPKSNKKVTRAFTNEYPEAKTEIIKPSNISEFLR
jgi:predicted AAA+ superfamily ATPase